MQYIAGLYLQQLHLRICVVGCVNAWGKWCDKGAGGRARCRWRWRWAVGVNILSIPVKLGTSAVREMKTSSFSKSRPTFALSLAQRAMRTLHRPQRASALALLLALALLALRWQPAAGQPSSDSDAAASVDIRDIAADPSDEPSSGASEDLDGRARQFPLDLDTGLPRTPPAFPTSFQVSYSTLCYYPILMSAHIVSWSTPDERCRWAPVLPLSSHPVRGARWGSAQRG